jgi:hypothetical protein
MIRAARCSPPAKGEGGTPDELIKRDRRSEGRLYSKAARIEGAHTHGKALSVCISVPTVALT